MCWPKSFPSMKGLKCIYYRWRRYLYLLAMLLAQNWNQSSDVLRMRVRFQSKKKKFFKKSPLLDLTVLVSVCFDFFNRKFRNVSWPSHKTCYSSKFTGLGSKLRCSSSTNWCKGGKQPCNSQPVLMLFQSLHSQLSSCRVLHPLDSLEKTTELTAFTKAFRPCKQTITS